MAAWLKALALALLAVPVSAAADCRQALLLALDVSGSVDAREYRLQLDGLAAALTDPQVVAALEAMPGAPVRIGVMEWSGLDFQRMIVPWTDVTDQATLFGIVSALRGTTRVVGDYSTALGAALTQGGAEVRAQGDCWRQVIDVSGDGISNVGPQPGTVVAPLDGITVNALVIGEAVPTAGEGRSPGIGELVAYFRAYVLRGEDAFLETAAGFDAFEAAMVRKLLRELQVVAISGMETLDRP